LSEKVARRNSSSTLEIIAIPVVQQVNPQIMEAEGVGGGHPGLIGVRQFG
jgi:hypothetical protein